MSMMQMLLGGASLAAPVSTAAPTISGTTSEGQTLTSSTGSWSDSPSSYAYQWKRGGVAISGATSVTYVLVNADVGATITVTVTATNAIGSGSATSSATAVITASAPVNTGAPGIFGTPQDGQSLSASTGSWNNTPTSYAYQWRRSGSAISGATSSSYTCTSSDVGSTMSVTVTASNSVGSSSATSSSTGTVSAAPVSPPVNLSAPTISGTPTENQTLSANVGSWSNSPTSYSYQWRRNGSAISAFGSSYTLTSADVGSNMSVTVTASNSGGSNSATSSSTSTVASALSGLYFTSWGSGASISSDQRTLSVAGSNAAAKDFNHNKFSGAQMVEFAVSLGGVCSVGVGTSAVGMNGIIGLDSQGVGYNANGTIYAAGSLVATATAWNNGDVPAVGYNLNDGTITFWLNGVFQASVSNPLGSGCGYCASAQSGGAVTIHQSASYSYPGWPYWS